MFTDGVIYLKGSDVFMNYFKSFREALVFLFKSNIFSKKFRKFYNLKEDDFRYFIKTGRVFKLPCYKFKRYSFGLVVLIFK